METTIRFQDFLKVELRVGTIIKAEWNNKTKKPAYILEIDFGEKMRVKKSSAQITEEHPIDSLPGKQIIAVTNFSPKNIAGVISEVLVLAAVEESGRTVLLEPSLKVSNGSKVL